MFILIAAFAVAFYVSAYVKKLKEEQAKQKQEIDRKLLHAEVEAGKKIFSSKGK
jgi:hypothetical protein